MQQPSPQSSTAQLRATILLAAGLAVSTTVIGQPASPAGEGLNTGRSPFYYGASLAVTQDSNIFRVRKGDPETEDTYSTISLLAGLDQPFGRQRATANVAVRHTKYQDLSRLDNTGYRLGAGLDWETIERLSGTVQLLATKALARYGTESAPTTTERNIESAQQFDATVQYGGQSILTLYGLFGHRAIDYSLAAFDSLDYSRNHVGAGLRYRVGGALQLGIETRLARGEYPHFRPNLSGGFDADKFDRSELAVTARWEPTGASRFSARLAATKQDREIARDFSGATGSLSWDWRPTGKLRFETEFRRDTGQEVDPLQVLGADAIGDNSEVSNRLQLRGLYAATAKIDLDALVRYTRRSLVDTLTLINVPGASLSSAGHDATTVLRLGANYAPLRTVTVGCSIAREDRTADSTVSYGYRASIASCYAQLLLN